MREANENTASMKVPHPFDSGDDLMELTSGMHCSIVDIMWANENAIREESETRAHLDAIWNTMQECVRNGLKHSGILPGGLRVKRRAPQVYQKLLAERETSVADPLAVMDWVGLYALAVNEENAAGGRVVTAPTNGAAGIIPAVLHYATEFSAHAPPDGVHRFPDCRCHCFAV